MECFFGKLDFSVEVITSPVRFCANKLLEIIT